MKTYHDELTLQFDDETTGNAASGELVTVFDAGTAVKPAIFDVDGAPIANPLTTDVRGNYSFSIPDGIYDIVGRAGTPDETRRDRVDISENTAAVIDRLNPATLADWQNDTSAQAGDVVTTAENTVGQGGGGEYDVLSGTGTVDGFGIVQHNTLPLSADLRLTSPFDPRQIGINPGAADNKAAWQHLLTNMTTVTHVNYDGGSYKFLSNSTCTRDLTITGDVDVDIDCTAAGFTGGNWTAFNGTLPQIQNLSVNAVKGERTVTFASAPTLVVGDVFCIWNPTGGSFSNFRPEYFAGEWCKVTAITGSVVRIAAPLYDSYAFGDVNIFRLDGVKTVIKDLTVNGDVSTELIVLLHNKDSEITAFSSTHKNNSSILVAKSYNTKIDPISIHNEGDGGDDYGISISNSQLFRVNGGNIYSRRHAVTTGGGTGNGSTPCRDIKIIGSTLSNDPDSGIYAADFHGNTEDSQYIDCTIYGGVTWQGKNNGYVNCDITNFDEGVCVLGAEILGGRHYAENCRFKTNVNPQVSSRGIIDVGGNNVAITADTAEDVTLSLIGCSLNGINLSATTSVMIMEIDGSTVAVNIEIDNMTLDVDDLGQMLLTRVNSGTPLSNFIIVDNIKRTNTLTGKLLCNHAAAAYLAFPHRLQSQAGTEELTTSTSSPTVTGTAVTYNWAYPREPALTFGRSDRGFFGNRVGVAYASLASTTGVTPAMSSDDGTNFAAALTFDLSFKAEINEV